MHYISEFFVAIVTPLVLEVRIDLNLVLIVLLLELEEFWVLLVDPL